jgi:hypothetical protein
MLRWCEGACGRELPETFEYFEATGRKRYMARHCRRCRSVWKRNRRRIPTVLMKQKRAQKRYRLAHLERISAYKREYDKQNAERVKSYQRAYFQRKGKYLQRARREKERQRQRRERAA